MGQTQTMLKERLNTYRQHIWLPELQQIDVEGHLRTCEAYVVVEISKLCQFLQFGKQILNLLLKNLNLR